METKLIQLVNDAKIIAKAKKTSLAKEISKGVQSMFPRIYQEGFDAGKEYALKCAFHGVEEPPANPYN
jgi:hypothetical protein